MPSEVVDGAFNNSIRETIGAHLDYGPLHDGVGMELRRCINDSNVVLGRAPGPETDGLVRSTLQKVVNRCRTLAALLSCHGGSSTDVWTRAQYTMDVLSSACGSSSRARASSSRARASSSQAQIEEEEEEEETDEELDPDYIELNASQMEDALQPTQPSQPSQQARRASSRATRRPQWHNTPEGYINKGKLVAKRVRK